jgi:hypothetical protein
MGILFFLHFLVAALLPGASTGVERTIVERPGATALMAALSIPLGLFMFVLLGLTVVGPLLFIAAILVAENPKSADWGKLLARHRFELGVYSTTPDNTYRYIDGNEGKTEAPTHFFDIDVFLGPRGAGKPYTSAELATLPRDWEAFRKRYAEQLGARPFHDAARCPGASNSSWTWSGAT